MSISGQPALILQRQIPITNDEYKGLQTTPIQLVATPGAGFRNNFLHAQLLAKFSAGAYTGASAVSSYLTIVSGVSNRNASSYLANANGGSRPFAYLSAFNDATDKVAILVPAQETADATEEWGLLSTPITGITGENEALFLKVVNGGADFGGGNAANSLMVIVHYTVQVVA